jgi:hypothetical protein
MEVVRLEVVVLQVQAEVVLFLRELLFLEQQVVQVVLDQQVQ